MRAFKILFLLVITGISVVSCRSNNEKGIFVEIENSSNYKLTDVDVYTSDRKAGIKFEQILKGERAQAFLNMENVEKSDGAFIFKARKNNQLIEYTAGYYTNGNPLNNKIAFLIKNDTVIAEN